MANEPNKEIQDLLERGNVLGQQASKISGVPHTPTVLTSKELTPSQAFELPKAPIQPDYQANVASIPQIDLTSYLEPTPAEQQQDTFNKHLLDLQAQLSGQPQAQARQEAASGLPQYRQQLTDISGQIQSLQKEAAITNIEYGGALAAQKGTLEPFVTGERDARIRQIAVKALGLSAIAQTLQGQIGLAQQQADRAVELEFQPKEAELKFLQLAYEMNKDKLTRQEKKRGEVLQIKLNERQRILTDAKVDKTAGMQLANVAIQNYASDPATQIAAQKVLGLDPYDPQYLSKVFSLVGKYQRDPEALKTLILQQKKLQIDVENAPLDRQKILADIQYTKSQIAKNYADANVLKNINLDELTAYATEYASTGKIPTSMPKGTFGLVAGLAKEIPKQKGEVVDTKTGIKSAAVSDTLQGAYGTIYSVIELGRQLKDLDKERWGGILSGTLGKIKGDVSQQRYIDLRDQISDLLARARTGAAINATEETRYYGLLPGRLDEPLGIGADSQVRIDNFINIITSDLKNKIATQGLSIYGLSKVHIGNDEYTVGEIITYDGKPALVLPDGSISIIP